MLLPDAINSGADAHANSYSYPYPVAYAVVYWVARLRRYS
jgi:hypothetical protein